MLQYKTEYNVIRRPLMLFFYKCDNCLDFLVNDNTVCL